MAIERIVDTSSHDDDSEEQRIEVSLRPQSFAEYVGQERLKRNLRLAIDAAKKRGEPLDHVLLYGPPGLGKTTMATVIANEMGTNLRITSGFKLDIVIGKGPAARSIRLDLPRFTVIGATTRTGSLAAPLRDRFGHIYRLEFYTPEDIAKIVTRSAKILESSIRSEAANLLSTRARLTPRIANRLLKRVRDYADVNGDGIIDVKTTTNALEMLEVDELGLDPADRNLLQSILENYGDNPVGLTTIAALTGDEATTIEDFYEPYLLQIGFIERTPRGRRVTIKAKRHLGK